MPKYLFSIKKIDFVSKRNMEEFSVVIIKITGKKTKGRHVTYNTRQSVLRRKRIYASFVYVVYSVFIILFCSLGGSISRNAGALKC